jgi:uncharacterized repeat protein (TIGR01451 family)
VGAAPAIAVAVIAPDSEGTITNTASVDSAAADPDALDNTAEVSTTVTTPPPAEADLSVAKTGPSSVQVSASLAYTLWAGNAGPDVATGVTVTDPLPVGTTYVSASGTGWACGHAAGTVTCTRPQLAVGAAPPIVLSVTAPQSAGLITNTVSVGSAVVDPVGGNNTDSASTMVLEPGAPQADVWLTKAVHQSVVAVGSTAVYTLTVGNAGPDVATAVVVTDPLPAGMTYLAASGAGWTCSHTAGVVRCDRPALSVDASTYIEITVTVPTTAGPVTNTASVGCAMLDPQPANGTASVETTVSHMIYLPCMLR